MNKNRPLSSEFPNQDRRPHVPIEKESIGKIQRDIEDRPIAKPNDPNGPR